MTESRLQKSYTIRTYIGKNKKFTHFTLSRSVGYGMGESIRIEKQTVLFFNLLFQVFDMIDSIFDFLGNSEN